MKHLNDLAFGIAQKIQNDTPEIERERLVSLTTERLCERCGDYTRQDAVYAAITQVAQLENITFQAIVDLEKSTNDVIFIRRVGRTTPQAVYLDDILRMIDQTETA